MSQELILVEFKRLLRENQTCIDELEQTIKQSKADGIFPNKAYKAAISAKEKKVKFLIKFKNYLEKHNLSLDYLDQVYIDDDSASPINSDSNPKKEVNKLSKFIRKKDNNQTSIDKFIKILFSSSNLLCSSGRIVIDQLSSKQSNFPNVPPIIIRPPP